MRANAIAFGVAQRVVHGAVQHANRASQPSLHVQASVYAPCVRRFYESGFARRLCSITRDNGQGRKGSPTPPRATRLRLLRARLGLLSATLLRATLLRLLDRALLSTQESPVVLIRFALAQGSPRRARHVRHGAYHIRNGPAAAVKADSKSDETGDQEQVKSAASRAPALGRRGEVGPLDSGKPNLGGGVVGSRGGDGGKRGGDIGRGAIGRGAIGRGAIGRGAIGRGAIGRVGNKNGGGIIRGGGQWWWRRWRRRCRRQ